MIVTVDSAAGQWQLTDRGRYNEQGVQATVTSGDGLDGWFDGPPMRTDYTVRPQAPGAFDSPGYADARVIIVKGAAAIDRAENMAGLARFKAATAGLLADGTLGTLTVDDPDTDTLQAQVRLSDKPTVDPKGWNACEFELQFTAPDPVRYSAGDPLQTSTGIYVDPPGGLEFPLRFPLRFSTGAVSYGRLAMSNPGTADTWPVITLYGPSEGPAQQAPMLTAPNGDVLAYQDPLAQGEYLVINTREKTVLLQGQSSRRYRMSSAQFDGFKIPAGSQLTPVFSTSDYPNASSRAVAQWRAGWW